MAAYRRVYDSRHLQADCQQPGSAPEPYIRSVIEYGLPLPFYAYCDNSTTVVISESLLELLMALACTMMYMQ